MRYVIALLLTVGCCSCATAPKAAPVAAVVPVQRGPVILPIHTRDKVIAVRAGQTGPTYSVLTARGEILVPDMTLGQLAQHDPELYRSVQSQQADSLWAGSYLAGE